MPQIDLMALRRMAVEVISEAADIYGVDAAWIADKGDSGLDLVTSLDLDLQAHLVERLPELLDHSVALGEEEFQTFSGADRFVWLIDPLDGTVNFAAGVPFYAISVALFIDGEAALAVVLDMPHRCVYSAAKGHGAFLDDKPLVQQEKRSRLAALSSGLLQDLARRHPEGLVELLRTYKLRNLGSQALQLCYAATGALSLVASREAKGWDDAAGALIATEAGLKYGTYRDGQRAIDADQFSLCSADTEFSSLAEVFGKSCALSNEG